VTVVVGGLWRGSRAQRGSPIGREGAADKPWEASGRFRRAQQVKWTSSSESEASQSGECLPLCLGLVVVPLEWAHWLVHAGECMPASVCHFLNGIAVYFRCQPIRSAGPLTGRWCGPNIMIDNGNKHVEKAASERGRAGRASGRGRGLVCGPRARANL